jgi:cell division protein FtsZ
MDGAHMVFITAGMGGGTGTGAAPVIARMARERGILTVGVVTKPFTFEGQRRAKAAETGITELQQFVDTLIVIPNQNLFRLANERTGWKEAFKMADHVLYMGVRGVTDLMVAPGLVNLDFADIRTVMAEMGKAMMGTGEADGENRAIRAAEAAISNPLLEDTSMAGARGLLINITGGEDMTLFEVDQAANRIREEVAEDANIIFGSAIDDNLTGRVRVSVVATGIDTPVAHSERPRLVAVGGGMPMHAIGSQPDATHPTQPGTHQPVHTGPIGAPVLNQPITMSPASMPATSYAAEPAAPVPAPAPAPAATPVQAAHPAPAAAPISIGALRPSAPHYAVEAAGTHAPPAHALPHQLPNARPAAGRTGLFSEPPRQAEPAAAAPSRSLFGIVTGVLRGRAAPPAQPAVTPARAEPSLEAEPSATVRPAGGEEVGLDIPAFLRRQSS